MISVPFANEAPASPFEAAPWYSFKWWGAIGIEPMTLPV